MAEHLAELLLLHGDRVVHTRAVAHAVRMGRAPDNDLVLADTRVSGHHAIVLWQGDALVVRDLGSTNGTFVGDQRVSGVQPLQDGDRLLLGDHVVLRVRLFAVPDAGRPRPVPVLEDRTTGVRYPLRADRLKIGSDPECTVRFPLGKPVLATVTLHDTGELTLGTDDEDRPIGIGEAFTLSGHEFVFVDGEAVDGTTERVARVLYRYKLRATLGGATGPQAVVEDPSSGRTHRVTADNRATLLYILGQKVIEDRAAGLVRPERGWCPDDAVQLGIWGKRHDALGPNNYQVLVCRTRKELNDAGFDGWFIEKRSGYTRIRLDDVDLTG